MSTRSDFIFIKHNTSMEKENSRENTSKPNPPFSTVHHYLVPFQAPISISEYSRFIYDRRTAFKSQDANKYKGVAGEHLHENIVSNENPNPISIEINRDRNDKNVLLSLKNSLSLSLSLSLSRVAI